MSTVGSCPQNHRWTTSQPNYNNDWGCTASKMASLIMKLIERGIIEDRKAHEARPRAGGLHAELSFSPQLDAR